MKITTVILFVTITTAGCTPAENPEQSTSNVKGLRTVVYVVPDLDAAKQWYQDAFGIKPYFDQPFYVGFDVNGYELGLDPIHQ